MTIDLKPEQQLDARLQFLADLAALSQGGKVSHHDEQTLANVLIEDDREPNTRTGEKPYGKSLADMAAQLWDVNEPTRFLNIVRTAPWLVTDGESKLLTVI